MKILIQIRPLSLVLKFLHTLKVWITSTDNKILQAQEVSFIEISVDQYQVCELEENSNCIVNDIQYVSAVQVFDPFTVKVSFTEEAQQEISNIEHLQSKHDASDLLVST